MALDKTNQDKCYNLGRLIALTEAATETPAGFAGLCIQNPLDKIAFHLREVLREGSEELVEVASRVGDLPSGLTAEQGGRAWIGYYHQRAALDRLAEAIKAALVAHGLTQVELAERLGVHPVVVSNTIHNPNVKVSTLERYAAAIGCDISEFFK